MKTKQEIFDHVTKFLLKQGATSNNEEGNRALFGERNRRCAIGCLLSPKDYREEMEEQVMYFINRVPKRRRDLERALAKNGVDTEDPQILNLLKELREVHDFFWPTKWKSEFEELRHGHQLA